MLLIPLDVCGRRKKRKQTLRFVDGSVVFVVGAVAQWEDGGRGKLCGTDGVVSAGVDGLVGHHDC